MEVRLFDVQPYAAERAKRAVLAIFATLVGKGRMTREEADSAGARLTAVSSENELAGCDLVIEAIVENLVAKQELFKRLEAIVGETCILATNTSSLSVTAIASACARPSRVAGFHFFNPVPLMKVVEVVPGLLTDPQILESLVELARRAGHHPALTADTPGFIVNHAGRGYGTEALTILQEGVADFAEIDRILREAAGFRMGPFELLDLTGLDVSHPVMESIYAQFYQEPRYRPSYRLRQRLAAGLLGRKSGEGFYSYSDGIRCEKPSASTPIPSKRYRVWTNSRALAAIVEAASWPLDHHSREPSPESLCLIAHWGSDATSSSIQLGLDAKRTVAVDPIFDYTGRRTAMTTPLTTSDYRDQAHAVLAADGTPVSVIGDSPGFVVQRVIANIVNTACEIAQQRIASPRDIDEAVMLGLGYPWGPLALGDRIGPHRLLTILETILEITGDPRYRPSLWLSRRARLGISLLSEPTSHNELFEVSP